MNGLIVNFASDVELLCTPKGSDVGPSDISVGSNFKNAILEILVLVSPAAKGEEFARSASPLAAGLTRDAVPRFGSILNPNLNLSLV